MGEGHPGETVLRLVESKHSGQSIDIFRWNSLLQIAAIEIAIDHLLDIGPPESVLFYCRVIPQRSRREWIAEMGRKEDFLNSVRRDSFVNRPLGDEAFVSDLEKRFQLRLARGKAGRPVKVGKREKK